MTVTTLSNDNVIPFVISDDLHFVFDIWAKRSGMQVPDRTFFSDRVAEIKSTLETAFPRVVAVDGTVLRDEMSRMGAEIGVPIISMDKIYMPHARDLDLRVDYLDITRAVDADFESRGLICRANPMQPRPLMEVFAELSARHAGQAITLIDDVVFTGGTLIKVIDGLNDQGVKVGNVIAGISVGRPEGMLAPRGTSISSAYNFPDVVDEICCRDFVVGAGGRTILTQSPSGAEQLAYAPYMHPFGNPEQWASLPSAHVEDISHAMMQTSKRIWNEIGKMNGRPVLVSEIGHRVHGLEDAGTVVDSIDRAVAVLHAQALKRACA